MTEQAWFRPMPGLKIPVDPLSEPGRYFPPEGERTTHTLYLQRRLNDGDVEIVTDPAEQIEAAEIEPPVPKTVTTDKLVDAVNAAAKRFRDPHPQTAKKD